MFFAFPISSVLTRRKPAPELSTKSWVVKETQIPLYTSIKKQVDDEETKAIRYLHMEEEREEEEAINKNVKPPTSVPSWFSRSIAKQEDKTAKLSKSKLEINNLWKEKQEAEKIWIEAIEKEEAEQRERRVEYFKLNATLVENQAKQIIKAETLQFFHNVMKFKSERNDGNVNIQSCDPANLATQPEEPTAEEVRAIAMEEEEGFFRAKKAPGCQQFGWFQHLLPEGEDLCITLLILDKLSAKCNLDPSSVDVIVPIGTEKSNFICRLMKSKIIQPDHIFPVRSGEDSYGIPYYNKGGNTAVNKESFTYCDAIAIVGKVVKSSS